MLVGREKAAGGTVQGWWLWVLGGCTTPSPGGAESILSDQARYREALLSLDPQEAVRLCGEIADDRLRRECLVLEAGDLLRAGGDAEAVCWGLETPEWRSVCFFELVDKGRLRGAAALEACQRTGTFQQRCVSHALQREELSLAQRFPPGQEAAMMAHIREMVAQYGLEAEAPPEGGEAPLEEVMVGRLVAERKRHGAPLQPFSRADCGSASAAACAEAYRMFVLRSGGKGRLPADCTLPMDGARIAALGLPTWSEDAQDLADTVWGRLCQHRENQSHQPPDHQNSRRGQGGG